MNGMRGVWKWGAVALIALPRLAGAELMIVGNDQKVSWDDAGKQVFAAPGQDSISIVDIGTDPTSAKVIANLELMNSIFGPPTNLVITPDEKLALATNAMNWVQEGGAWKPAPDNKIHVIDLEAAPPALIATVEVGQQPSGMAINQAGDLALVANPSGKVVVLEIDGKKVTKTGEVDVGGLPEGVVFSKDGGHLYVGNYTDGDVSVLKVDGSTVTNTGQDLQLPGHPASMRGSHP
jgi:DNA-binding beta-propeller fold protein YncE